MTTVSLYNQLLERIGIADPTVAAVILVYAGASLFALLLRIIACVGYQTQHAIFRLYGKDVGAKADAAALKNGLVGRAATDYMNAYEKGAASVSAAAAVNKNAAGMGLLFWKYDSMARFITGYENSVVLIGLLLAVFLDYPAFFGVMAIASFLVLRVFASLFDFELAKEKLVNELILYLEREIGQFYAPDLGSGMNRLRTEMTAAAANQAAVFEKSLQNLGAELGGAMKAAISEIAIDESIKEWKSSLAEAAAAQGRLNGSVEKLDAAAGRVKESAGAFGAALDEYLNGMKALAEKMNGRFESQEFIEKNQALLNDSFNKFELSLQDITGKFGNSLASIVDHRVRASYDSLNDAVTANISRIINSNNELIARLQKLFDTFGEQSAAETQAILKIKDQMDLYHASNG